MRRLILLQCDGGEMTMMRDHRNILYNVCSVCEMSHSNDYDAK